MTDSFETGLLIAENQKTSLPQNNQTLGSLSSSYLTTTCRTLVLGKLKHLRIGSLTIVEPGSGIHSFGTKGNTPSVEIHVVDSVFWPRLLFYGPMVCIQYTTSAPHLFFFSIFFFWLRSNIKKKGFAEAYMDGIIRCRNLTDVLEVSIPQFQETWNWTYPSASGPQPRHHIRLYHPLLLLSLFSFRRLPCNQLPLRLTLKRSAALWSFERDFRIFPLLWYDVFVSHLLQNRQRQWDSGFSTAWKSANEEASQDHWRSEDKTYWQRAGNRNWMG